MALNLRKQHQFKRDLEQNRIQNLRPASKVNICKYVEMMQHETEHKKSVLSNSQPKAETKSLAILVCQHVYLSIYGKVM
jgi:hypothetical protein